MDRSPGSQSALRRANSALVLRALIEEGPLSHAELARHTGLSRASVTNIVRDLQASEEVRTFEEVRSGRRARIAERLAPSGLVAAVNVGRTHLRVSISDLGLNVLSESEVAVPEGHQPDPTLDRAAAMLRAQLTAIDKSPGDLLGVVAGFPAPLERDRRTIGTGALLRSWVGTDLQAELGRRIGVPVVAENDANLGALGEFRCGGYGRDVENLIYIRVTTGIGAGMVLGGRLHRGATGVAGEIGHIGVEAAGALCRCGNRGCLEQYAIGPEMPDLDRVNRAELATIEDLVRLAAEGEVTCRRVIDDMARHLGSAVASLCTTLNPDVIAFAGPITAADRLLLDPIRQEVSRRAVPEASRAVQLGLARLGHRSEVLGALSLGADLFGAPLLDDKG